MRVAMERGRKGERERGRGGETGRERQEGRGGDCVIK